MEEEDLVGILKKKKKFGLSITDIVNLSGLSRSTVRITLAKLEGAKKVVVRRVGMAKVYIWSEPEKRRNVAHATS